MAASALASMNLGFTTTLAGTPTSKFLTQSELTAENGFMSRDERVKRFGVDCNDDITWRVWNVGGEYERRFLIKNTCDKRQIISYRLPKQKATFFVDFPEPATISSGMSYALVVRFRPLELVEHHDELEVSVKGRGSFKIRLDAFTPYAHLTTPAKYDFNMCPVRVSTQHTFPIRNTGTVPLQFYWEIPAPFSLSPSKGSLLEGQSMNVVVSFTPQAACACVGQAICRLTETNEIIAVTNFSGIGKFAFIRIKDMYDSENVVDFGDVLTSSSEVKYVTLMNPSFVDTDFDLQLSNPDITNAFTIAPMRGTVPRGGETRLTVKFTPKNSGAHYTSDFNVNSVSCATKVKLRCTGTALAPRVFLSATNVDFGDVDIESIYKDPSSGLVGGGGISAATQIGQTRGQKGASNSDKNSGKSTTMVEKWITVNNDSDIPIRFQFAGCDPGCAFKVTPSTGQLKAKSSSNVKITFTPTSPMNHLRRLFVMTSAGDNALILDVFGSAYTSKIRPAPFNNKAVQLFFSKLEYGLGGMTPEEAERLIAAINGGEEGTEYQRQAQAAFCAALDEISSPKRRRAGFATVFPKSVGQHTFPFTIDKAQMTVRHETVGQSESVVVRNHTGSKATAVWSVPEGEGQFWSVEPLSQDVPANGTATFRITCAPNAPPQTFGSYLECYVNYKTMRSFRLVNEDVFTPPHCLLVQCTHLAPYRENGPVPAVKFVSSVSFQPCREQRSVYQVLELTNDGDTAMGYDMLLETSMVPDPNNAEYFSQGPAAVDENGDPVVGDPEEDMLAAKRRTLLTDVFQAYPSAGTLPAKSTSMVLLKFSPPLASKFFGAIHISYNGAPSVSGNVLLKGEGFVPKVELGCDGVLAFRPTTVGGTTTRQYTITNLSRIPLAFQALIPAEYRNVVSLSPAAAILKGSERLKITATFTPDAVPRTYEFTFPFEVSVPQELDSPLSTTALNTFKASSLTNAQTANKRNAASSFAAVADANNAALGLPVLPALADNINGFGVGFGGKVVGAGGTLMKTGDKLSATCFTPTILPPDVVTTQQCLCKAEAHAAFLSVEPLSKDLGDISVGGPSSFPLTIYNTGLSDACFELRYKLISCDAVDSDPSRAAAEVASHHQKAHAGDEEDPVLAAIGGTFDLANIDATHIDPNADELLNSADATNSLVSFSPSSAGTIRARSHHTVSVSTKLALRGKHTIIVYAVCGGDLSVLRAIQPPMQTARGEDQHENQGEIDGYAGLVDVDTNSAAAKAKSKSFADFIARLPQSKITACGQNARLQIVDTRCVYQQKSQLWRQMSIGKINAVLASEVDKSDEKMRALSFDDSLTALAPVMCNLGADNFHAAPIRVYVALSNDSTTSVDFRFRFPLDNEIPKEPWHADQRGLDDPIANVVDRGLFDISPRTGTVAPHDQVVVTFTYFHSEVGRHQLPVILRVEDGKQVLLLLTATTIEPGEKYLLFHHDMAHELSSVAIGDLEPPIQYTEVQNLSSTSVSYSIDEAPLTQLKEANYDFPILQCLNPRGTIPPMSSLLLSWFFRPLEAKDYTATVNVSVEGGRTYAITLNGKGYHPKQLTKKEIRAIYEHMFPMPRVPVLEHPSMPIRLSSDLLNLGAVPFHSYHRRHVALTNSHPEDTFLFEWRSVLQHGDQIFEIEPSRGTIEPGVTVHFCVSMYSGSFSHIIDTPVHCHVMNESLRQRRQIRVAEREEQRRLEMDQKPETAATEFGGTTRSSRSDAAALTGRGLKPRQRHAITTVPPRFQSTARLQKTIQKLEETALAEEVDENAEEWAHVEVTPTVLELLIQTRIMPLDHFIEAYGEEAARAVFFPTMLGNMHPMRPGYFLGEHKNSGAGNSAPTASTSSAPAHHLYASSANICAYRPESVISDSSLTTILERRAELQRNNTNEPHADSSSSNKLVSALFPAAPIADVTSFERDIATGCIKEILRRVVKTQSIVDALNDPSEDPTPYFCEMIATSAGGESRDITKSPIAEFVVDESDAEDDEGGAVGELDDVTSGGVQQHLDYRRRTAGVRGNQTTQASGLLDHSNAEEDFANGSSSHRQSGLARAEHDRQNYSSASHRTVMTAAVVGGSTRHSASLLLGSKATPVPSYADEIPIRKASIAPSAFAGRDGGSTPTPPAVPTPLSPSTLRGESVSHHHTANAAGGASSPENEHPSSQPTPSRLSQRQKTTIIPSDGEVSAAVATDPTKRLQRSSLPVPGDVQCVAEEVIGDVIFYLMSKALTKEGVITQACSVAKKQRRASEARIHDIATSSSLMLGYGGGK